MIVAVLAFFIVPGCAYAEDDLIIICKFHGETMGKGGLREIWFDEVQFKIEFAANRALVDWYGDVFPSEKLEVNDSRIVVEVRRPNTGWHWWFVFKDYFNGAPEWFRHQFFEVTASALKEDEPAEGVLTRHAVNDCGRAKLRPAQ